jgi:GT2 family glycosyltransferase
MSRTSAGLGICIVNYFTAASVAELMRTIVAHRDADTELAIAIVDNSSEAEELDESLSYARANGIKCQLRHGHGNVGYAAGNNLGASWLLEIGADIIWILNPDTRVTGGSLSCLGKALPPGSRAIGATRSAGNHTGTTVLDLWTGRSGSWPVGFSVPSRKLPYVAGHSVAISAGAWAELGGLSEEFFLFYEEADLAVRSGRLAIPVIEVADLIVQHLGGQASGATYDLARKSTLTFYHASRSCMIFFRKHYPKRLPIAFTARLGYALKVVLRAGPRAALAVARGCLAGLKA